ncbi:FG-GAP repeat domain-containing protein [Blastococcus colisei]|uniref:FG-GAP repeat domain-containing protein n=1 Tax=Blastococcus colisei TaxID=1564162 RepID=UPI0014776FE2|nr:VCBS repeat-containing protein [Blastococcus colisei]
MAAVAVATVASWSPAAASDSADRLTGEDPAHAAAQAGDTSASAIVPLPDLGIAHRLPSGGMNLWRIPLSELETGYGRPQLVKTLNFGGFSYDRSVTLAGDFGDITPSDDGTTDFVVWHAQPNGGVLLWAVGGGSDTTPRLLMDLRTGGWSWADSRPMVGDVNGDGWDDLVVRHRYGTTHSNVWVIHSDGSTFGPPELWYRELLTHGFDGTRHLMADIGMSPLGTSWSISADGWADWWAIRPYPDGIMVDGMRSGAHGWFGISNPTAEGRTTASEAQLRSATGDGWSYTASRQLVGDVTGDGLNDLVSVHRQGNGGLLLWVHLGETSASPWQDLRTGGWSYAGSRQHLADTNGDGMADLISVHSQTGNPGMLIWRSLGSATGFEAPEVIADLKTGGWSYSASRESVADLYGEM